MYAFKKFDISILKNSSNNFFNLLAIIQVAQKKTVIVRKYTQV